MSAWGGGAEADGHFLDDDCHAKREGDEGEEESDAKSRSGGGVGKHAGAVVFSQHNEDTGADQQPQQARPGGETALGAGGGDANAVVSAVDVFVSDYYFFFGLGEDGLHRVRRSSDNLRFASGRDFLRGRLAQVYMKK